MHAAPSALARLTDFESSPVLIALDGLKRNLARRYPDATVQVEDGADRILVEVRLPEISPLRFEDERELLHDWLHRALPPRVARQMRLRVST